MLGSSNIGAKLSSAADDRPVCPAWSSLGHIPCMNIQQKPRPPIPGGTAIPGPDSGSGNGGAGGAKNLQQRFRYQPRRLDLATYNARTLRTDEKIIELEEAMSKLRWDILGLSEIRREGENSIILESGNLFYYREGDQQSQGGVGFIVHKFLVNNVVSRKCVEQGCVPYTLNNRTVFAEGYTGLRTDIDEEVKIMYEDISKAMHASNTYYNVVMGDYIDYVRVQE